METENFEDSSNSSEDENNEDQQPEEERQKIKERLSKMSFEDLQKLKEEMGVKVYNQTVVGVDKRNKDKTLFKRANKNRPREMSSKKPVKLKLENNAIPIKKKAPRDPRFESMCGTFDKKTFKDNYKFINDIRIKEKKQLENELKKTTDPEEKNKLKFLLQRLNNQIREEETREKRDQDVVKERTEVRSKLEKGEKLHFKKKSVKRLETLINKYEDLKKTNKIQKHIERRSKKISAKERRKLERQKIL